MSMRLSERAAKAILEQLFPSSRMEFSPSQSHGEHDFDLVHPSGAIAAIEVTASADATHLKTLSALSDPRRGGPFVKARKCKHGWYVQPEESARIRQIRMHVDEYLAAIEEKGIREFFFAIDAPSCPEVARIGLELRIESGKVFQWKHGLFIGIASPGRGGWLDPDSITAALEAEASKRDNIAKLVRSGRAECHLFVWVDSSDHHVWGPMVSGMMPQRRPELPTPITRAWIASSTGSLHAFRVLAYESASGWLDFGHVLARVHPDPD